MTTIYLVGNCSSLLLRLGGDRLGGGALDIGLWDDAVVLGRTLVGLGVRVT
jgi:hypothetical protein